MKRILFVVVFVPFFTMAQKAKTSPAKTAQSTQAVVKTVKAEGYKIEGEISGYPDGTTVEILNANTGAPEATSTVQKEKFVLTGRSDKPDFKVLSFNHQQPYLTLFLDNSEVKIKGKSDALETAKVKGSQSHDDFVLFNETIEPYKAIVEGGGNYDSASRAMPAKLIEEFVRKHPSSYVSPLAIYRLNQLTMNDPLMEEMYNKLAPDVKNTSIGNYIAKLIADSKKNPVGSVLAEFSQQDTSGNMVSLSSFRGKYVLVDFWASWCGPCRQENPNLVAMYQRFKDKNFTVLGVSLDKTKEPWLQAIKNDNLAWSHVSDLQGWSNAVSTKFEIFSIPQNFLIDPQGRIIAKNLRGPALETKLGMVIK